MAQGTRKEIIAELMKWSATWGLPLSREQAEAKADQAIKGPHWGWFIVFMIVAVLWIWFIVSTIAGSDFGVEVPVAMAVSAHLKKGQGNAD